MYLRCNRRFKDGKEHCYWNIVEAKRCADGRVVQRQVLYLGEINDSQHEAWCRVIEVFDEDTRRCTQLALFPVEREVPEHAKAYSVQVRLDAMQLHRPRQWGACWLACRLYEQLGLDHFWQHACRIVEKAPVGDTSYRHWWCTACSIPVANGACTECGLSKARWPICWVQTRRWWRRMGCIVASTSCCLTNARCSII